MYLGEMKNPGGMHINLMGHMAEKIKVINLCLEDYISLSAEQLNIAVEHFQDKLINISKT